MQFNVQLDPEAQMPRKAHDTDAGYDLSAISDICYMGERCTPIGPGEYAKIRTGVHIGIPPGYEAQVRGRSGLAFKNGIIAFNGTIDAGYKGDITVLLFNMSRETFLVKHGMRIAQLVIHKIPETTLVEAEITDETERGSKGFGSSGTHAFEETKA